MLALGTPSFLPHFEKLLATNICVTATGMFLPLQMAKPELYTVHGFVQAKRGFHMC